MKIKKRKIEILVLSDVHLGTYGCHAQELLRYLKSINPKTIVLNGDIIDIWQFSKRYWPKSHMKVVKQLMHWISKGKKTYYITGNHDEMLRRFTGLKMGSFTIVNKLVLELGDNTKAWIFHGDVFDVTMQHSKWLTKMGAIGYDTLILVNRFVNFISEKIFRRGKISLLKKFGSYRQVKSIVVTENGAAFDDVVEDGVVNDVSRQLFLQDHIMQVLRAREDGVKVNGYFVWTFTDNFEWAEGYRTRFGLVYVDFLTQKRIVKSSGFSYSRFIRHFLSHLHSNDTTKVAQAGF